MRVASTCNVWYSSRRWWRFNRSFPNAASAVGAVGIAAETSQVRFGKSDPVRTSLLFATGGAMKKRIDSSGRLLVGTSTLSANVSALLEATVLVPA
jgi:hypothetical protein